MADVKMISVEEPTWRLIAAVVKTYLANEAYHLALPLKELEAADGRTVTIEYDDGWYLLTLTDEPAPGGVVYPDRAHDPLSSSEASP